MNLDPNYKTYSLLSGVAGASRFKEKFQGIINTVKAFFTLTEFDTINRVITAILKLGDMRTSVTENKDKFPAIYDLLKINNPKFFKFLLLDKTGLLLSNQEYQARIEALIEFLYNGLVNLVVEKINIRFKEQYYEQFVQDKKATNLNESAVKVDNNSKLSRPKSPSIDSKKIPRNTSNVSPDNKTDIKTSVTQTHRPTRQISLEFADQYYQQLNPRTAMVIIDALGFIDLNRYGDFSEQNDNKFEEFTANLFFESFLGFFNKYRYDKSAERMANDGLSDFYKKINYIDNNKVINGLNTLKNLIVQSATDRQSAITQIRTMFPIFQKNIMQKLNKRDEDLSEDEDKRGKLKQKSNIARTSPSPKPKSAPKKSDISDNHPANIVTKDIEYIAVDHSFSEVMNYDLDDLFERNKQPYLRKIRNMLWDNRSLSNVFFDSPERFPTRLQKQQEEQNEFFDSLLNSNIYFFNCLKIPFCKSEKERANAIFMQFKSMDFESLVEHHINNYPYRISYPFFIEKFNVMAKVAQISPNINIDFEQLVRSILTHMFGENHSELFVFGKEYLYVKERFYLEIDSLLKESGPNSRILGFVEAALREILSTHVDNKQTVIMLAQKFLRENCGAYPLTSVIKSKEKNVKLFRSYKYNKAVNSLAHGILDDILDKIEYYPIKKMVKIQANIRGYLDRKVNHPVESQAVAKAIFKQKFDRIRENMNTTLNVLISNNLTIQTQLNSDHLASVQASLIELKKFRIDVPKAIKTLTQFAKWGISKIRLRKYLLLAEKRRKAAKVIKLFLEYVVKNNKIYYNEENEKRAADLQMDGLASASFSSTLNRLLTSKGLAALPMKVVPNKEEPVVKKKAALSSYIYSVERLDENWIASDAFCKNLMSTLGNVYKEELQKVELFESETLLLTQKQRLVIFQNDAQRIMELKLPNKSDRYSMLNSHLVHVEETGVLKSKEIAFSLPNPGLGMNDISFETGLNEKDNVFGFTKFRDLAVRKSAVLGATECRKICYKESIFDLESPMRVFQFKRPIAQLSLGDGFMIAVDETGVVYATGKNSEGQLGLGHCHDSPALQIVKRLVENKEVVKSISSGAKHTLVVTVSNKVYGWGSNYWMQFGEKARNFKYIIKTPRDVSSYFELDKDVKIQAACGKYSSYILTSTKKFIRMGRINGGLLLDRPQITMLTEFSPAGTFVVGLNLQWNSHIDLVSFRVFDSRNSVFDKGSMLIAFANNLFELFTRRSQLTMLPYADNYGNMLPLSCLNSKLADVHNKKDASKLNKMVENFLYIK